MPTAFWASALLVLAACGDASGAARSAAVEPSTVEARTVGDSTRLDIRTGSGARRTLVVGRDSTVAPQSAPLRTDVVGEVAGAAVVVLDTYASRPGGMSLCQAGEERFLRVVTLRAELATETARVKVASCRGDLELASPDVEWLPDSATIRIHWLIGPGGSVAAPETRTIRIGPDGLPRTLPAR